MNSKVSESVVNHRFPETRTMRLFTSLPPILAICRADLILPAVAELIPSHMREAQVRLANEPNPFDRTDNFWSGKNPGDARSISGVVFAGSEHLRRNQVDHVPPDIDMSCFRTAQISVDRLLLDGQTLVETGNCNKEGGSSGVCKKEQQ